MVAWADRIRSATSRFGRPLKHPSDIDGSRDQVVGAATRRLAEEPMGVLTQGLSPSRFESWMPGLRRKAYRYFPSTTDLVAEVLRLATELDRSEATTQLAHATDDAAAESVTPVEAARVLPTAFIDRVRADEIFRLQLVAWTAMDADPELRDALLHLQGSLVGRGIAGLRPLIESYGMELRPPVTWEQFGIMWLTMVEGTAIRAGIQSDDYDPDVMVAATMGLLAGMTRRVEEDDRDLEEAYVEHFDR